MFEAMDCLIDVGGLALPILFAVGMVCMCVSILASLFVYNIRG
jgi:hypothetical protein